MVALMAGFEVFLSAAVAVAVKLPNKQLKVAFYSWFSLLASKQLVFEAKAGINCSQDIANIHRVNLSRRC
jgi:hypothetical protein